MEDLAAAVQSILNDPQSMAQLQGVMNSLGMNPPQAPAPASPPVQQKPAAAAPLNLLNTLNNSDPMTAMLLRAAPLLASATARMTPRDCLRRCALCSAKHGRKSWMKPRKF